MIKPLLIRQITLASHLFADKNPERLASSKEASASISRKPHNHCFPASRRRNGPGTGKRRRIARSVSPRDAWRRVNQFGQDSNAVSFKNLAVLVAMLLPVASPRGFGHTLVDTEVTEGKSTSTFLRIEHACGQRPVIAQSIVIPTVDPVLERSDGGPIHSLTEVLAGSEPLTSLIIPYYDRGVFSRHRLTKDERGSTIGFSSRKGKMPDGFKGQIPIYVNAVFFNPDSCASQLQVKLAGADICNVTSVPAPGDVNLWIPNKTAKFPDGNIHGSGDKIHGGSPIHLTINRDLQSNPLPQTCGNKGYTVTVWPSDKDVDEHLPIPNYWPKP